MENASKALMIAAGVLMGVLILSLGIYLFHVFGDFVSNTQAEIAENELTQFNQKYLKYNGLTNLTIQDVLTVKNNALQNNYSYSSYILTPNSASANNDFIDVYIQGEGWILDMSDEELLINELENNASTPTYTCTVQINTNTRRVNKITFIPN